MKPDAILVNCTRAALVDHAALGAFPCLRAVLPPSLSTCSRPAASARGAGPRLATDGDTPHMAWYAPETARLPYELAAQRRRAGPCGAQEPVYALGEARAGRGRDSVVVVGGGIIGTAVASAGPWRRDPSTLVRARPAGRQGDGDRAWPSPSVPGEIDAARFSSFTTSRAEPSSSTARLPTSGRRAGLAPRRPPRRSSARLARRRRDPNRLRRQGAARRAPMSFAGGPHGRGRPCAQIESCSPAAPTPGGCSRRTGSCRSWRSGPQASWSRDCPAGGLGGARRPDGQRGPPGLPLTTPGSCTLPGGTALPRALGARGGGCARPSRDRRRSRRPRGRSTELHRCPPRDAGGTAGGRPLGSSRGSLPRSRMGDPWLTIPS